MKPLNTLKTARVCAFAFLIPCSMILSSCEKEAPVAGLPRVQLEKSAKDMTFYALCKDGKLRKYNAGNLKNAISTMNITGLPEGQSILAMDFRPATGQLYGLGSDSRIYVIQVTTGAARVIGAAAFSPMLDGKIAGFDFNPTVDRIRVVTSNGQNLRINPETGAVAVIDGPINGVLNSSVSAVAYTNSTAGSATTILFDIDVTSGTLYKQNPPNSGGLVTVGSLGVSFGGEAGFDISAKDNTALAVLVNDDKATLYDIDLNNGKAYKLGDFDNNRIISIAIPSNPVAYAVDANNNLLIFNPDKPLPVSKMISGIGAGEKVLGIDFRPANGQLYALGSSSKIYTLNASSGAALVVGTMFSMPLSGDSFGFDFNPVVDRIRIISNTGQNLRVHPETGIVAFVDGMLKPGRPSVTAAAYANNFIGTPATSLFVMDTDTDKLFLQNPPNDGTLAEIGSLGNDFEAANGFDIGGTSNMAYAIMTCKKGTLLYAVDLQSGKTKSKISFPSAVSGFTLGLGF